MASSLARAGNSVLNAIYHTVKSVDKEIEGFDAVKDLAKGLRNQYNDAFHELTESDVVFRCWKEKFKPFFEGEVEPAFKGAKICESILRSSPLKNMLRGGKIDRNRKDLQDYGGLLRQAMKRFREKKKDFEEASSSKGDECDDRFTCQRGKLQLRLGSMFDKTIVLKHEIQGTLKCYENSSWRQAVVHMNYVKESRAYQVNVRIGESQKKYSFPYHQLFMYMTRDVPRTFWILVPSSDASDAAMCVRLKAQARTDEEYQQWIRASIDCLKMVLWTGNAVKPAQFLSTYVDLTRNSKCEHESTLRCCSKGYLAKLSKMVRKNWSKYSVCMKRVISKYNELELHVKINNSVKTLSLNRVVFLLDPKRQWGFKLLQRHDPKKLLLHAQATSADDFRAYRSVCTHGGVRWILDSMETHTQSQVVQEQGCRALAKITKDSDRRFAIEHGAVDLILRVVERGQCTTFKEKELRNYCVKLSALPENARVPTRVLTRLWELKTVLETQTLAEALVSSGLLEREITTGTTYYRVHDLCRDFGRFGRFRLKEDAVRDLQRCMVIWAGKQSMDALILSGTGIAKWEQIYQMCMSMEFVDGGRHKCGEVAELMCTYGLLLGKLSRLAEARRLVEASLEMQYAIHPDKQKAKTESIARTLHNIGNVLRDLGDMNGARKKYEASLEMKYAIHPDKEKAKTESIATTLHNFGSVLYSLGDMNIARKKYEASLEMKYAIHPDKQKAKTESIATTLHDIGCVLRDLGDPKGARKKYEASLEMWYAIHPDKEKAKTHPIATTLHNIGSVLYFLGDPKGARAKYEASLEMDYAIHPDKQKAKTESIATTLHNIGCVLRDLGDMNGARAKYEASLEMKYAIHPDKEKAKTESIARTLHNIGNVLRDLGDPKGARKKYEASLEMKYAIHPEGRKAKTQSIATTLEKIGNVLYSLGDMNGARKKYEASLEIKYAIHPDNPGVLRLKIQLAFVAFALSHAA